MTTYYPTRSTGVDLLTLMRFWTKVDDGPGCWEWRGYRDPHGYGRIRQRSPRRSELAHRFAWRTTYGDIAPDMCVCHRCDNPACVRPDHLWLGSQADNQADKMRKGRHRSRALMGDDHPRAKLTSEKVLAMRAAFAEGTLPTVLALRYGVGLSTVCRVVKREGWRHV